MLEDRLDYDIRLHYEVENEEIVHRGYTIRLFTERVVKDLRENLKLNVEKLSMYHFDNRDLYKKIRDYLSEEDKHYIGLFGDDSWPLYAKKHKWHFLNEKELDNEYPLQGKAIRDNCIKLEYL